MDSVRCSAAPCITSIFTELDYDLRILDFKLDLKSTYPEALLMPIL